MPQDGLEWTCPPDFFEDQFSNLSKSDEERLEGWVISPFSEIGTHTPYLQFRNQLYLFGL